MVAAVNILLDELLTENAPIDCDGRIRLVDSVPIILAAGRNRKGKVAPEISNKGYCSTKNMYYYGVKLHFYAAYRKGSLPSPEKLFLLQALKMMEQFSKSYWLAICTTR